MSETPTATGRGLPLREHALAHLPDLHVGEELLALRYASSCTMDACSARCCREGALVDLAHRDRVLALAPLVIGYMEPAQERNPARWFDDEEEIDLDFPSGAAVNTNTTGHGCVFLDSRRRCVLQLAEAEVPDLKPFFCRAYPITIVRGRVTIDPDWCPSETQCCGPVAGGTLTALDVCAFELAHTLGEAGARELSRIATATTSSQA